MISLLVQYQVPVMIFLLTVTMIASLFDFVHSKWVRLVSFGGLMAMFIWNVAMVDEIFVGLVQNLTNTFNFIFSKLGHV